ncbi:MAG: L-threonylcarbamoyladenylate synthase [Thermodesulfobacteriota bacterium]|nr:L-threonylcarbamoyladenylate synthase [Thermodesulfobacteriota bacterium]
MPLIIKINPHAASPAGLEPAIKTLLRGGVIAGPTQTFYGLMAAADQPQAMARVLELKGRDSRKPLLLLLDTSQRVLDYAQSPPKSAADLAEAFWPGPLTLLVPAKPGLDPALAGPSGGVGLRVEGLPIVRTLVQALGRAVTGTSANPGGEPPARTMAEVLAYFGDSLDLILDGGPCPGAGPSTLIDACDSRPRLLRPGVLGLEELRAVVPDLQT